MKSEELLGHAFDIANPLAPLRTTPHRNVGNRLSSQGQSDACPMPLRLKISSSSPSLEGARRGSGNLIRCLDS